jgi:hypothetical protein
MNIGRPIKITESVCNVIIDYLGHDLPIKYAAEGAGICERTFFYWLEKGEKDLSENTQSLYASFLQAVKKVQSDRIKHHLDKIDSDTRNWTPHAWKAERRYGMYSMPDAARLLETMEAIEAKIQKLESHQMGTQTLEKTNEEES